MAFSKLVFIIICILNYCVAEEYIINRANNKKLKVVVVHQNETEKSDKTVTEADESGKEYVDDYQGEYFPTQYLLPDDTIPTMDDINMYLDTVERITGHYTTMPNRTDDVNQAVGLFYTKALFKRCLMDYDHKMSEDLKRRLKKQIYIAEDIVSHYIFSMKPYGWSDYEFRISQVFKDDQALVYSIQDFNRNRLQKWILKKTNLNTFSKGFDTLAFSKEKYVELVAYRERYYINISDSNICLSNAAYNPMPIDLAPLRQCKYNRKCDRVIHGVPTVGYSLSHKMLNLLFPRITRRCYIRSAEGDMEQMENMCASMYREAVYLARRGFFARDLFLEHLSLCSFLGYEEFHRRQWYQKAVKMIDKYGCMSESYNFRFNYTNILMKKLGTTKDEKTLRELKKRERQFLLEYCEIHPMAMAQSVLAHAIRHALHYLPVFHG